MWVCQFNVNFMQRALQEGVGYVSMNEGKVLEVYTYYLCISHIVAQLSSAASFFGPDWWP
jgi:hypothetical protein